MHLANRYKFRLAWDHKIYFHKHFVSSQNQGFYENCIHHENLELYGSTELNSRSLCYSASIWLYNNARSTSKSYFELARRSKTQNFTINTNIVYLAVTEVSFVDVLVESI